MYMYSNSTCHILTLPVPAYTLKSTAFLSALHPQCAEEIC